MKATALAVGLALSCGSCEFAQKHPVITAGIAGGSMGLLGCEMDAVKDSTCLIVGGSTAVFLGGIAALAMLLFDSGEDTMAVGDDEQEVTRTGAVRLHTRTAPPPVVLDAGAPAVDGASAPVDAPAPVTTP